MCPVPLWSVYSLWTNDFQALDMWNVFHFIKVTRKPFLFGAKTTKMPISLQEAASQRRRTDGERETDTLKQTFTDKKMESGRTVKLA